MISPYLYSTIFLYLGVILTLILFFKYDKMSYERIKKGDNNFIFAATITLICALWIGMRPVSPAFGDTINYAHQYNLVKLGIRVPDIEKGEWIWAILMTQCAKIMPVSDFFTIIEIGYFGFTLWACKRLTPNNVLVSLVFNLAAFSFFSYGTNGIRNGLACSMILTVMSFALGNRKDKIIAAVLAFIAFNIHHSVGLPIVMLFVSMTIIRTFKSAYTFWLISILVSLLAGGAVTSFFATLGFDDRMHTYLSQGMEDDVFSHTGFRWDFLIYSVMPIILGYYTVVKRKLIDKNYIILLNTYILSNATWVMIIQASFSNRFAYLSWFMYPIVLAYPLLKVNIWGRKQGLYLASIMLAHTGFTWFMDVIYY